MKNRPDRADVHQGGTRRRRMTSETQEGAPAVDSTVLDALARAVRGDHHAIAGVDSQSIYIVMNCKSYGVAYPYLGLIGCY